MKRLPILLLISFIIFTSCRSQKIDNLKTFAKAYGYVKYFHPSDEAFTLNWQKFSAYGAKEVMKCNNQQELLNLLNSLFNPVAPSVKFLASQAPSGYEMENLIPNDSSGYRLTYWQHLGLNFDMQAPKSKFINVYKSTRVDRTPSDTMLFTGKPQFQKILLKSIGQGIYCQFPMVLYCNAESTYPSSDPELIKQLRINLSNFDFNTEELSMRLGNVIDIYNVFQHFYPYFDVVDVNWDS